MKDFTNRNKLPVRIPFLPPLSSHGWWWRIPDLVFEGLLELAAPTGSPLFIDHHCFKGQSLSEIPRLTR